MGYDGIYNMKVSDYSHTGHEIAQAVLLLCGTPDYFLDNVFNYPTLAECYQVAALDCANRLA